MVADVLNGFARRALTFMLGVAVLYQLYSLAGAVGFSRDLLARSLKPNGGVTESLPPQVVEARQLVSERGVRVLQLSPSIASDSFLQQRTVEGLYPVRIADEAPVLLATRDDDSVASCVELSRSATMGLYECRAKE